MFNLFLNIRFTLLFILCNLTIAHAEVYLTKDAALDLVLGTDCEHLYQPKELTPPIIALLKSKGAYYTSSPGNTANFFLCQKDKRTTAYALIDSEIGKHLPITYIVGISPEGQVTRVEMMVFREVRGWEARERRFMQQFEGNHIEDSKTIGTEIRNVAGATLSSRAIEKGVKRALLLWEYFFKDKVA